MSVNDVKDWYFNTIPNQTDEFIQFLSNAHKLGHSAIKSYTKSGMDHATRTANVGHIPQWIFNEALYDNSGTTKPIQVSVWNTAILLIKQLKSCRYPEGSAGENLDHYTFAEIVNTLNSYAKLQDGAYGIFPTVTLDFMYNINTLCTAHANDDIEQLIFHYMNPELREYVRGVLGEELTNILQQAIDATNNKQRERVMLDLYNFLNQDNEQGDQENNDQNDSDDTSSDDEQEENNSPEDGEQGTDESSGGAALPDDFEIDDGVVNAPYNKPAHDMFDDAMGTMNDVLEGGGWERVLHADDNVRAVDVTNARFHTRFATDITPSDKFKNLGTLLAQLKVINDPPIIPQRKGNELLEDELYRVKSDQHIYGTTEIIYERQEKEVVILCDLSGSTNSDNLWLDILQAAYGAYNSLVYSRDIVSVYAHSTIDVHRRNAVRQPIVYKIAAPGTRDVAARFTAASKVHHGMNYDNLVIDWLCKNAYTHPERKKVLIVLSDGKPCGSDGISDTIYSVNRITKCGVSVISVSLTQDAVYCNNEIYGSNNIDGTGNLDNALSRLLVSLI